MRKPIQLIDFSGILTALCDDGSMWMKKSDGWEQLPEIPEPQWTTTVEKE
jgi:hypothetical protein